MDKLVAVLHAFDFSRGFGFLRKFQPNAKPKFWFLHVSNIVSGLPQIGCEVHFVEGPAKEGKEYPSALEAEVRNVFEGGRSALSGKLAGGVE